MSAFFCQCRGYRGNLIATEREFYFTCSLFRVDLAWSNVKRLRLETQEVKGVPRSVLVVVLQRNEAATLHTSSPPAQKKPLSSSRKYYFYDFYDLLRAEEQIRHLLEEYRMSEKANKDDARDELEKGSSVTVKQRSDKVVEKDDVSSLASDVLKDESPNNSRTPANRNPDTDARRTGLGLSFAGRRASLLSFSRPKFPGKLLSVPPPSAPNTRPSKHARVFLKLYRYVAAVLVVVMLALFVGQCGWFSSPRTQQPLQAAEKLLHVIQTMSDVNAKLASYDSHESLRHYNKRWKDLGERSRLHVHEIVQAAVGLMEHYVVLQAQMLTLRGRRAQRVAREQQSGAPSPPPPPTISAAFASPKMSPGKTRVISPQRKGSHPDVDDVSASKASAAQCEGGAACPKMSKRRATRSKELSWSQLMSDLRRWTRLAQSAWRCLTNLRGVLLVEPPAPPAPSSTEHLGSTQGAAWVAYTENLGDHFQLVELVSAAEDEDRRRCLQLTQELLETVDLIERLFVTFSNALLMDRYRQLESREESASHWLQPPQALRSAIGGRKYYAAKAFSSDVVVLVVMLRRFVSSLVHNEPLVASQAHRRSAALRVADAMLRYQKIEVEHLRARNRGYPGNTTQLWRELEEKVLQPATLSLRDNPGIDNSTVYLRNSIAELRFWHTHSVAWHEHVLSFFTPEEQADIRRSLGAHGSSNNGFVDLLIPRPGLQWVNLPLLRGLLCFAGVPHLRDVPSEAADNTTSGTANASQAERHWSTEDTVSAEGEGNTSDSCSETVAERGTAAASMPDTSAYLLPLPQTRGETFAAQKTTLPNRTTSATPRSPQRPAAPPTGTTSLREQSLREAELWREVKLRWMADLDLFRVTFDTQSAGRRGAAARSHCLGEEERGVSASAADVRCRLFGLLSLINENYVRYLIPTALQRLSVFLQALLPPYSKAYTGKEVYISTLQHWGSQDPAVQLATAQVTGIAPGTTSDISRSLLYLILQPPPLLQTSVITTRQTTAAVVMLLLFVGILIALYYTH
ncbi:hypothetical protein JKF63_02379 [Porcisia hertigi]|uniref:Transmembrane protein n=1 Tax=Porcisia hertigi TaxID=2761500 RepID=A0A836HMZ6_9TRYP|nr:hypothetical protein JKF63_02379 [Porcisia hertigi]